MSNMTVMNNWAHSCCSPEELALAISNDDVKFIESDIIISSSSGLPVMAHPPAKDSDLTFKTFMEMAAPSGKGLKLDFKDPATVLPCLKLTSEMDKQGAIGSGQTVWLNADILPGPGSSSKSVIFDASAFVETCMRAYPKGVLSLGWKVSLGKPNAFYTEEHCNEMLMLVKKHGLQVKRIVFAVAARPCAVDTRHLKDLLRKLPYSELLIWTGFGEPPISLSLVKYLETEFSEFTISSKLTTSKMPSRITYDVNISTGVFESSLSESKLYIHRFIHRLDDLNHFFIIKFLNLFGGNDDVLNGRVESIEEDDEEEDVEQGNSGNNRAEPEPALAKAKRVIKQTVWLGLIASSGVFTAYNGRDLLDSFFSYKYNPFRYFLSGENDGNAKKVSMGVIGALALSKKRKNKK